ncbi:hypothetical protein DYB30_007255, partial [Aphanomyces astaci]
MHAGNINAMTVDTSALVSTPTSTPATIKVLEVQPGMTVPLLGSFAVTFQGQTATIPLTTTVAALSTSLNGIVSGGVTVTSTVVDKTGGGVWDITFTALGVQPLFAVDLAPVRGGTSPTASVATVRSGTQYDLQVVSTASVTSGTFFLAYGSLETPNLAFNALDSDVQSAVNGLLPVGSSVVVTRVLTGTNTYNWTITFQAPNSVVLAAGGVNLVGQVTVSRLPPSPLTPVQGGFTLTSSQGQSVYVPATATDLDMKSIVQSFPALGMVSVARSGDASVNAFVWAITYLENAGPQNNLTVASFNLTSSGQVGVSIAVTQEGTAACCLGGSFRLASGAATVRLPGTVAVEQKWPIATTSQDLTAVVRRGEMVVINGNVFTVDMFLPFDATRLPLSAVYPGVNDPIAVGYTQPMTPWLDVTTTSPSMMLSALTNLPNMKNVLVSRSTKMINNGYSWSVTFAGDTSDAALLRVTSALTLGSIASTVTTPRAQGEIRMIYVSAMSTISGTFKMNLGGVDSPPLAWNSTATDMKAALEMLYTSVNVTRSPLFATSYNYLGDGYGWFVTFASDTGTARTLTFIPMTLTTASSTAAVVNWILVTPGTSTPLSGTFQLSYLGYSTTSLAFNEGASSVQSALNLLPSVGNVVVTRSVADPNMGYSWSITFLPNPAKANVQQRGDFQPLGYMSALSGTAASISITEVMKGSFLDGSFALISGSQVTRPIAYNAAADVVQNALQTSFDWATSVAVTRTSVNAAGGYTYAMTFPAGLGVVELLGVDTTLLLGTQATVTVQTTQPGVNPVSGVFTLDFNGAVTSPLAFNATSVQLQTALETLPTIANVDVTQTQSVGGNGNSWQVTFLSTSGAPLNVGDLPLLGLNPVRLHGTQIVANVTKVQSAVTALSVSVNGQDWTSDNVGFRYDSDMLVQQVSPALGPVTGGTRVVLRGFRFVNMTMWCLFGNATTGVEYISATTVVCSSPPQGSSTSVFVKVLSASSASLMETMSDSVAVFHYYPTISFTTMTPAFGSSSMATHVRIEGAYFVNTSRLTCRYTTYIPSLATYVHQSVLATFVSSTEIGCIVPSLKSSFPKSGSTWANHVVASSTAVEVSNNGQDYSVHPTNFTTLPDFQASALAPSTGPLGGGTVSTITLSPVRCDTNLVAFRFGNHVPTPATTCTRDGSVTCVVPRHRPEPSIYQLKVNSSALVGEVQTVTVAASNIALLSGSFQLRYQGLTTDPVAFNAAASTVQSAINRAMSPLVVVTAAIRSTLSNGYTWTLTFSLESGNIGVLQSDMFALEGPGAAVTVATIQDGPTGTVVKEVQQIKFTQPPLVNEVQIVNMSWAPIVLEVQRISLTAAVVMTGSFTLSYNSLSTASLPFNAEAVAVQSALQGVVGVGSVNVTRTHALNTRGFVWDVTFLTSSAGSRPDLTVNKANIVPSASATLTQSKLIAGTSPLSGTFVLSYLGFPTTSLAVDISAAALQTQLATILPPIVAVTKSFAATCTVWRITFGLTTAAPSLVVANGGGLSGSGASVTTRRDIPGGVLMGGTFKVAYNSVSTSAIPLSATALATALAPIAPSFTISSASTTFSIEFNITFAATAGNVPLLVVDASTVTGTTVTTNVTTVQSGSYAPLGGSFQLTWNKTQSSGPIAFNAANSTIAAALQLLPGVGTVMVGPRLSLVSGYQWQVTFMDSWKMANASNLRNLELQGGLLTGTNATMTWTPIVDSLGVKVPLFITTNGQAFVDTSLMFTYHDEIVLDSMDPLNGPVNGSTTVTITLAPQSMTLSLNQSVYCRFGVSIVTGSVLNATRLECISPEVSDAGDVSVEISVNGMDFSSTGLMFQYRWQLQLVSVSPLRGPIAGGTLLSVAMAAAVSPLDVFACIIGGQVVPAEQVNASHVFCRTPPLAVGSAVRRVAVEITCNHQIYSTSDLQFTYTDPLYLTGVTPAWGPATGGTTVKVRGGDFDLAQSAWCRFGEKVVDGLVESPEYIACQTPQFDPVGQVQRITTTASGYVPDVQDVVVSAAPDQPLVQVVTTSGATPLIETQVLSISGQNVPEIQVVQPTVDTLSSEIRTISTTVAATVTEVKTIQVDATPIHEVQQITVTVNTAALTPSQFEVQALWMPISPTETGSFALEFQGAKTPAILYNSPLAQLQAALEALDTVGTLRITTSIQTGYNVWAITFLQNTGLLPLLVVDSSSLVVVAPALVSVQSVQVTSTVALGGSFAVSYNGQSTVDIPVRSSATDVQAAIQALPTVQNPVLVTRTDLDCNGGASWIVKFVSTSAANGNIPTMTMQGAKVTGTLSQSSVSPVTDSNALGGSFKLSFQGTLSPTLYLTTTETAMAAAVQTLTQVPVASVTRRGPTAVNGYSWQVTFGGAPSLIPDILGVSFLTGIGATVRATTTRVAQVLEIQQLTLSASSFIGGSFRLQVGSLQTLPLPSDASATAVQNALNALVNVGTFAVSKSAVIDVYGSCSWQITFLTLAGNQNMIQVLPTTLAGKPSLFDSGSRDVRLVMTELQAGMGGPLAGTFRLSVDGSALSDPISYDATASEVQRVLQAIEPVQVSTSGVLGLNNIMTWSVTFTTPKPTGRILTAVTTGLTPGSASVVFGTTRPGVVQEIRRITTTLTSGAFVCTFASKTSGSIPFNANSTVFGTALSAIAELGTLDVSGTNPWLVTFTQLSAPIPVLSCGPTQGVTTVQTSTSSALSGTFKLGFNNVWTTALAPNASALTVQNAINAVMGAGSVTVSGASVVLNNGQRWDVTFTNKPGTWPLLTVDKTLLVGTNAAVQVTRKVTGNYVVGTFQVAVNGRTTVPLTPQATAGDLMAALQSALSCRACTSVVRSPPLSAGGYAWTVQFRLYDAFLQTFSTQLDPSTNPISVVQSTLNCTGLSVQVTRTITGSSPISGSFVLRYRDQPTVPIPWDATPETVLLAVQHIKSIPKGLFQVTRSGPFVTGGMQWRITFPFNIPYPSEVFKPVSFLAGSNPGIAVTVGTPQTIPVQGTFALQFQSQVTSPIAFNANASDMATALQRLSSLSGGVTVTTLHSPWLNTFKWRVSFTSLANAGPMALLSSPIFQVNGSTPHITFVKVVNGTSNALQRVTISAAAATPTGTFTLSYLGVASPVVLAASCSALEFASALNALSAVGKTTVERTVALNGQIGFTWYILFTDSYVDKVAIALNTGHLLPTTGLVVSVALVPSKTTPISGSFQVQYGQTCIDGIDTSSCVPAVTSTLPYNVDATTLQHELSMLPGLSSVQVSRSVAADYLRGYTWLVSFPDTLGNLAMLRTSSALTGSNAKVEVSVERAGVTFDESKVAVAVSQNGQDYTTMSTVVYQYVQTILVYSTFPNHGPVFGGTEVVVYGDYFTN